MYSSDAAILQKVLKFGEFAAIAPNYNFKKKFILCCNWRRSYTFGHAVFVVVCYVVSIIGRIQTHYFETADPNKFLDFLTSTLQTIFNLLAIANSQVKRGTWSALISSLLNMNTFLVKDRFAFRLLIFHVGFFGLLMYDAYVWTVTYGFRKYIFYLFRIIQEYYLFSNVIIMAYVNVAIRNRCKTLNRKLKTTVIGCAPTVKVFVASNKTNNCTASDLRQISNMYRKVSDLFALFNKIYEWQMLVAMFSVAVTILDSLEKAIMYRKLASDKISGHMEFFVCLLIATVAVVSYCVLYYLL